MKPTNPQQPCIIVRSWSRDETWFTSHHVYADTFADAVRLVKARKQGLKGGVKFTLQDGRLNNAAELIL